MLIITRNLVNNLENTDTYKANPMPSFWVIQGVVNSLKKDGMTKQ